MLRSGRARRNRKLYRAPSDLYGKARISGGVRIGSLDERWSPAPRACRPAKRDGQVRWPRARAGARPRNPTSPSAWDETSSSFSPPGRRCPEGADEGAATEVEGAVARALCGRGRTEGSQIQTDRDWLREPEALAVLAVQRWWPSSEGPEAQAAGFPAARDRPAVVIADSGSVLPIPVGISPSDLPPLRQSPASPPPCFT